MAELEATGRSWRTPRLLLKGLLLFGHDYSILPPTRNREITMTKKICPTCHGNGYLRHDDNALCPEHRDCDTCDSQGEVYTAVSDPDTLLQDMSKSFPQFWRNFTNQSTLEKWTT